MTLHRYFEAHLAVKAEQVKQSLHTSDGGTIVPQQPFYKVLSVGKLANIDAKTCLDDVILFFP